jgi:hypothetical protein
LKDSFMVSWKLSSQFCFWRSSVIGSEEAWGMSKLARILTLTVSSKHPHFTIYLWLEDLTHTRLVLCISRSHNIHHNRTPTPRVSKILAGKLFVIICMLWWGFWAGSTDWTNPENQKLTIFKRPCRMQVENWKS